MRRVIHEFYALLEERRKLHAEAAAIEGNDPDSVNKRKDLLDTVESISERMDYLWAIKTKFEQDKVVPGEDIFEVKKEDSSADQDDKENDTIPEGASVDDLKTLKKHEHEVDPRPQHVGLSANHKSRNHESNAGGAKKS